MININIIIKSNLKLAICFLLPFMLLSCGQGADYQGDGHVELGLIIYPTFRVIFPEILIESHSFKKYNFQGVPSDELILRLALKKDVSQDELSQLDFNKIWNELASTNIEMELSISVNGNKIVSVGPEPLINSWRLSAYGRKYYFWNKKFNDLLLENKNKYQLKIVIYSEKMLSSKIYLVPIIEGGGFGKGDIYRN